jgi:ABC-type polysaccharide/polyol phosphate export permease
VSIAQESAQVVVDPGLRPARAGGLWRQFAESMRHPEFWALSSWLDIIVRARKSRFGILWLLAPSMVYVFGLGSFFAGMHGRSLMQFAAHVALGAMIFRSLMSVIIGSANVFTASYSFIMDGHVRLTDYLMQSLAKAFFDLCMYLPVVVLALVMYEGVRWQGFVWAPAILFLLYLNAFWISVVFSLAGARFPDFGQLLANISIFLFLLTPIIWYPEQMPADSPRGQFMRLNPFYHFVTLFRGPILGEPIEQMSLVYVGAMTVVGLGLATWLYRRYARFVPLWI